MRVCPKCGHKDPILWRHKRFRLFTDYCHIQEMELFDSKFAEEIKKSIDLSRNGYIYHLTKAGYIDRIHESDSADGKHWHEPTYEKPRNFRYQPPNQRRLSEAPKK